METADGRRYRGTVAILIGLLFSLAAHAQELTPGMEPYLIIYACTRDLRHQHY